jgi:hypothetical protein
VLLIDGEEKQAGCAHFPAYLGMILLDRKRPELCPGSPDRVILYIHRILLEKNTREYFSAA